MRMARYRLNMERVARWRGVVERFEGWAGTGEEFCRVEGIGRSALYKWHTAFRLRDIDPAEAGATQIAAAAGPHAHRERGRARQRVWMLPGTVDGRSCRVLRLTGLVRRFAGHDPGGGDVYVFFNRTRSMVTTLRWDGEGYVLWHKRLGAGYFPGGPSGSGTAPTALTRRELEAVLGDVRVWRRRGRTARA